MTVTRTLKIKDGDRNRKLGNEKRMDGRVEYSFANGEMDGAMRKKPN